MQNPKHLQHQHHQELSDEELLCCAGGEEIPGSGFLKAGFKPIVKPEVVVQDDYVSVGFEAAGFKPLR